MMKPSLITIISFLIIALSCPLAPRGQESVTATRYNLLSKQYDNVSGFEWSLDPNVVVEKNGKKGVVNVANKLVIPLMYDEIKSYGDLFIVYQNGLTGVVDENNKQVIPIEYAEIDACPDKNGLHFMVAKYPSGSSKETSTPLMGLMDDCGNVKIPLAHVNMKKVSFIEAMKDVDGRIITSDSDDSKHGLLDFDGRVILPQEYDEIVNIATNWRLLVMKGDRYGIVDWQGNIIMPMDYNDMVFDDYHSSGFAARRAQGGKKSKYAFWDFDGNKLSDEIFDNVTGYSFDMFDATIGKRHIMTTGFYEGMAAFAEMGDDGDDNHLIWGYMDAQGKVIMKPQFPSANGFSEGLAAVALTQNEGELLYGYIDASGKTIIPPAYTSAGYFMGGMAVVATPGTGEFVINKQGQIVKVFSEDSNERRLMRDEMGQVLIKEVFNDGETRFYNAQGKLVKAVIDGVTLTADPK
ncbi:MAG: WG repeat-containing protein [Muribaculaceae bacterium]|nr:WG repeat-containing protein [Muribaculaceae bacterium]